MKKIFLILFLSSNSFLIACSCAWSSLKEEYYSSDVIFTGIVLTEPDRNSYAGYAAYNFRIIKSYKGPRQDSIIIYTGWGGGDCGFHFNKGHEYLVYANLDEFYYTSICSRTCYIDQAAIDLGFLDRLPGSLSSSIITGKVYLYSDNSLDQFDLPVYKNFNFTLENRIYSYSVSSDNNGVYYLENIQPGIYNIKVDEAINLALQGNYNSQVEVGEADVREFYIKLSPVNFIGGRLLDENNLPVTYCTVELIPEKYFKDQKHSYLYEYETVTDESGKFHFQNLPGGRYYLGINLNYEPDFYTPYQMTCYKDSDLISSDSLLELNEENNYSDITLKIKKTYKSFTIKCRLRTADGTAWNEASVMLKKSPDNKGEFIARGDLLNDNGEYLINTIEDTEGWLVIEPGNIPEYSGTGLFVKPPLPLKIEPNRNYDDLEIILELTK